MITCNQEGLATRDLGAPGPHCRDPKSAADRPVDEARQGEEMLRALVAHRQSFPGDMLIEAVQTEMNRARVEFAVVVEQGEIQGLLSRAVVNQVLGSRSGIGFAVYAKRAVRELMHTEFLQVSTSDAVTEVLAAANARLNGAFHQDVVLVDGHGALVGLIPVRAVMQLQHRLLLDKIDRLDAVGVELKRMNDELAGARDHALSAARAKTAFLANMSHEIRTPLNGVVGMISIMQQTPLNDEQRECLQTVERCGNSLLTVLNDVLDFSKIESGRLDLEVQPVDVESCVVNCLHLFSGKAAEKGLELIYRVEPGTPVNLACDPTRLQQVLTNLVGNAIKFTDCGEIYVNVHRRTAAVPGQRAEVVFEIHDTGIGIPKEKISRLFQPFTQLDAYTSRRYGGTGLGLAICRRLVELMGGSIGVESEFGHGAKFWFSLPVDQSELLGGGLEIAADALSGKQLLVLERNATTRRVIGQVVATWGMRCTEAASAEELGMIAETLGNFDFILVDASFAADERVMALTRLIETGAGATRTRLTWMDQLGRPHLQKRGSGEAQRRVISKPVQPRELDKIFRTQGEPVLVRTEEELKDCRDVSYDQLRILVAEDNLVNQRVVVQMLKKAGCRAPDLAGNGRQAVAAATRTDYDLVLMDVQMPEMDGLEATMHLRKALPEHRQPFIVALTANALTGDAESCLAAGMDAYIAKPLVMARLIGALNQAISARSCTNVSLMNVA